MRGLTTVFKKEIADTFASWRFLILFGLVLLACVFAIYVAAQTIRTTVTGDTSFIFIALYTTSGESFSFSFLFFIALLLPLIGIALGCDAMNKEKNSGTLSRLVSQPIYRDTIINGKFLAGVVVILIIMTVMVFLVGGIGLRMIGVPPTSEEVWRLFFFIVVSTIYGSFWLGLSMLFSVLFRSIAVSVIASIFIWLLFFVYGIIMPSAAQGALTAVADNQDALLSTARTWNTLLHLSPNFIYQESMIQLLVPVARTTSQFLQLEESAAQFIMPTALSMGQSLLSVWGNLITIILLTVVCFAISYVRFMREEIRS